MRRVFLDPDGSWDSDYLYVVVEAPTGVVYQTQCGGVACVQRELEGYLVPVGSLSRRVHEPLSTQPLTAVFHDRGGCVWSWDLDMLPRDRLGRLKNLVAEVPFWEVDASGEDVSKVLDVDEGRRPVGGEAWVPVRWDTGTGILTWPNCD